MTLLHDFVFIIWTAQHFNKCCNGEVVTTVAHCAPHCIQFKGLAVDLNVSLFY